MGSTKITALAVIACPLTSAAASAACAQSHLQRLIRAMVPHVAGGSHDTIMLIFGEAFTGSVKQPVTIVNPPSAGEGA